MPLSPTSLKLTPSRPVAPRFGWTTDKPPQYEIKLSRDDFKDLAALIPTDAFVKKLGDQIGNPDPANARFALITNTLKTLQTQERVLQFHKNLMPLLTTYLGENYPVFAETDTHVRHTQRNHYDPVKTPHRPGQDFHEPMHRDGSKRALQTISYGPFENLNGGFPKIRDLRQVFEDIGSGDSIRTLGAQYADLPDESSYFADMGVDQLGDFFASRLKDVKNLPADLDLLEQNYTLTLAHDFTNDMPMLFINNLPEGIYHGASTGKPANPEQPAKRPLHRISMDMVRRDEMDDKIKSLAHAFPSW